MTHDRPIELAHSSPAARAVPQASQFAAGPPEAGGGARLRLWGAVAYAAVLVVLLPRVLQWDGIGFLLRTRDAPLLDLAHPLYMYALFGLGRALELVAVPAVTASRLLSVAGAVAALLFAARLYRSYGLGPRAAALVAAFVVTTPLFWRQAGVIDPSSCAVALLLASAVAVRKYASAPRAGRLALATVAFGAAIGFHVCCVLALPWLFVQAREARLAEPTDNGGADRVPRLGSFALAGGALVAIGAIFVLTRPAGSLGEFYAYARGFLPRGDPWTLLSSHTRGALRFLGNGGLFLVAGALWAAFHLARSRPRELRGPLWLAALFLGTFVALGKPYAGLLMPLWLAMGELIARALVGVSAVRVSRVLVPLVVLQCALALPEVVDRHVRADPRAEAALRVRERLPAGSIVLAARLAQHLRWFAPETPLVSLPDRFNRDPEARVAEAGPWIRACATELLERGAKDVYITGEALEFALQQWGVPAVEIVADELRFVRLADEPEQRLYPLFGTSSSE